LLSATLWSGCQCSEKKPPASGAQTEESPTPEDKAPKTSPEDKKSETSPETEPSTQPEAAEDKAAEDTPKPLGPRPWGGTCQDLFKLFEKHCVEGAHEIVLQQCAALKQQVTGWETTLGDNRDKATYAAYEQSCQSLRMTLIKLLDQLNKPK